MSIFFEGDTTHIGHTTFTQWPDLPVDLPYRATDIEKIEDQIAGVMSDMTLDEVRLESHEFSDIDQSTAESAFVINDELAKGRTNSRHKVQFGQLVLWSKKDYNLPTLVAVKPEYGVGNMAHEWTMYNVLNSLSNDQTGYIPLGVWHSPEAVPQLITRYEHEVQSMDNIFWPDSNEAPKITSAQLLKAYRMCFYAAGILHGAGLSANDGASIRNFARDSNRIRFVDPEELEFVERVEPSMVAYSNKNRRLFQKDVTKLITSSIQRGKSDGGPAMITEPIVFEKARRLITGPALVTMHNRYLEGVSDGKIRSGMDLNDNLLVTRSGLRNIVDFAIELELQRPDPSDSGPQPSAA